MIDSIQIGVSSAEVYSIKHVNIDTSGSVVSVIPHNKPKSNNHDIMIGITIYIKNHDLIYRYDYDDLGGNLVNDFTIILNREKEVQWIVNPTSKQY